MFMPTFLHPGHVERTVDEGHVKCAALVHVDSLAEAGDPVQQRRGNTIVGRQLDAVDTAAWPGSEHTGRAGQPSTDLERTIFGANLR